MTKKQFEQKMGHLGRDAAHGFVVFERINKSKLDWLGVHALPHENIIVFESTDNYIGAIPLRAPVSGLQGGDLILLPKRIHPSDDDQDDSELPSSIRQLQKVYDLADYIGEIIDVEFDDGPDLKSGGAFRPPLYFQAIRFLDAFEDATHAQWRKFVSQTKVFDYPRSSTNWNKYALLSYDPRNALRYEAHINVLSTEHEEWHKLVLVYRMACDLINSSNTPVKIRQHAYSIISRVNQTLKDTSSIYNGIAKPAEFHIANSDPAAIQTAKREANKFLSGSYLMKKGWRIDVAVLFERYVQYLFEHAASSTSWTVKRNMRYYCNGYRPSWSLAYLEPDIQLTNFSNGITIPVDVKYKNHLIVGYHSGSDVLKQTFRSDLHQIIAYSSFEPVLSRDNENYYKKAMLVYPAAKFKCEKSTFRNPDSRISVDVYFIGVPFDVAGIKDSIIKLRQLICEESEDHQ